MVEKSDIGDGVGLSSIAHPDDFPWHFVHKLVNVAKRKRMAPQRTTIKFEVTSRPESAGLRIRSTTPVGVYASCADRDTAMSFFEYACLELAVELGLVDRSPGQAIEGGSFDWPRAIETGHGEGVIVVETAQAIADVMATGSQVFMTDRDAAIMDRFRHDETDAYVIVVRDSGEYVDDWLVDQIKEHIAAVSD